MPFRELPFPGSGPKIKTRRGKARTHVHHNVHGRGALRPIRQLRERGCPLVSVQESWLNGSSAVQDIWLRAPGGWRSRESQRRSDWIKARLVRCKAVKITRTGLLHLS